MTAPTNTPNGDPFAPTESKPSVSFKDRPVGTSYQLQVTSLPSLTQARDFDTRELEFWPDGNPKLTVATGVTDLATGAELTLWANKPSALYQAIVEAQQAAGVQIAVGGILQVTYVADKPNLEKPHLNPAKQYQVVYTPPAAFGDQQPQQPVSAASIPASIPASAASQGQQFAQTPQGVVNTATGQIVAPPAVPTTAPVTVPTAGSAAIPVAVQTPPVQAPVANQPTPEQIAAVRAAGMDPAQVFPGYTGG